MDKCQVCGNNSVGEIISIHVCEDCRTRIQSLLDKDLDMINYFMDVTNYPDADEDVANKLFNLSVELADEYTKQTNASKKIKEQNLVLSEEERIRAEERSQEFLEAQEAATSIFATEKAKRNYENLKRERGFLYQNKNPKNTIAKRREREGFPLIGGIIGLIGGVLFFPSIATIILSNINMYGGDFGQWEIAPYAFFVITAIIGLIILPVGIVLCDLREMVVCLEDIRSIEIDREWRELNDRKDNTI